MEVAAILVSIACLALGVPLALWERRRAQTETLHDIRRLKHLLRQEVGHNRN